MHTLVLNLCYRPVEVMLKVATKNCSFSEKNKAYVLSILVDFDHSNLDTSLQRP